jgi:hypothetical protein
MKLRRRSIRLQIGLYERSADGRVLILIDLVGFERRSIGEVYRVPRVR